MSTTQTSTGALYALLTKNGIGAQILKLTSLLRKSPMPDVQRLLLATPGVYESILLRHFRGAKNSSAMQDMAEDTEGLRQLVMLELNTALHHFAAELVDGFIGDRRRVLDAADRDAFIAAVEGGQPPLEEGRLAAFLQRTFDRVVNEGAFEDLVNRFAEERGEIDTRRFTPAVRTGMVRHLRSLGLNTEDLRDRFEDGSYDEYFAQAYDAARRSGLASGDSLVTAEPLDSDFDLDLFDTLDDRGVVRENILAASALAYFHILGDTLGIFPLVNALLLRRARGRLDLPRGVAAQRMQHLKEWLRRTSVTTEDRQLLYRRVFNAGEGEVLPDLVVNEEYPALLHTLMEKVVDYIRKEETAQATDRVSRAAVDEAVRNLQYNLSYFANDIAEDTLIIKEHFTLATGILGDEEVIAALGVSRRGNLWGVLQRLVPEELNRSFSINTIRTLGVETYRVLQYVANFDTNTPEDEFRQFLRSAESLIIAQSSVGELSPGGGEDEAEEEPEDGWDDTGDETADEPVGSRDGRDVV